MAIRKSVPRSPRSSIPPVGVPRCQQRREVLMRVVSDHEPFNVLFLCTGNSARSIMAEAILNKLGAGRLRAYSAGSHPRGSVHQVALELLQSLGYNTRELRSKSWHTLADAPQFDFIFTVCDDAAAEVCPVWPGHP